MGNKMNTEQAARYAKWKALISEQEQSGKSQKKFCEERGLVLSQFVYYRSMLKPRAPKQLNQETLIPITIKNPLTPTNKNISEIRISLPNGFQCAISSATDILYVKRLMEVLSSC